MELHFWIKMISIFWCNILGFQYRMRIPSITIPISSILLESTSFSAYFGSLFIFVCRTEGRINVTIRTNVSCFGSAHPLFWLNQINLTIQAGWDLCNSDFPYLWLEAFFDLSTRASLVRLKPVVANPLRFILISGLWKIYLVLVAKVFACKL